MRFLGKSNVFRKDLQMNGNTVTGLKEPVVTSDSATLNYSYTRIISGAVASKPATLLPNQLWCGY